MCVCGGGAVWFSMRTLMYVRASVRDVACVVGDYVVLRVCVRECACLPRGEGGSSHCACSGVCVCGCTVWCMKSCLSLGVCMHARVRVLAGVCIFMCVWEWSGGANICYAAWMCLCVAHCVVVVVCTGGATAWTCMGGVQP